ncbi:hypothetical protein [Azospirillum ramasamyi]|uniref:hypothetical protein n=1 Tax=Azospirillum ramasamyi TaxID=682998 RepID=UPI00159C91E9|nr:hypothetical protein [Azospirillum ramasamyi]
MVALLIARTGGLRRPDAGLSGLALRQRHVRQQNRSACAGAVRGAMEGGFAVCIRWSCGFRWSCGLVRHDGSPRAIIRINDCLPDEPVVNLSAFEEMDEISEAQEIR